MSAFRKIRYLAQIAIHEDTDSANKRIHNVINGNVLTS